jgi:hypothetical protein
MGWKRQDHKKSSFAGFEGGGRWPGSREYECPLETGLDNEMDFYLEPPERGTALLPF